MFAHTRNYGNEDRPEDRAVGRQFETELSKNNYRSLEDQLIEANAKQSEEIRRLADDNSKLRAEVLRLGLLLIRNGIEDAALASS